MKVAHATVITPGRCGLYETTREIVAGLRNQGVDSRLVDPTPDKNPVGFKGEDDRGALVADMDWALSADVLINHSGYDNTPLEKATMPVIHVAHGRPRSSFLSEASGSTPIYSYQYAKNKDPRWKACVTFWPEHVPYHRLMMPNVPIHVVNAPVDLEAWTLDGPKGYGFHGKKGRINIVSTDAFRDDTDPFVPLHAAGLFAREVEGVRIHVYGRSAGRKKGWGVLLRRIQEDGNLGELQGWVGGLANVYRAASFVITPNEIATRTVREASACGCPVVCINRLDNEGRWLVRMRKAMFMSKEDRYIIRKQAEAKFNAVIAAKQMQTIIRKVAASG